MEWNRIEKKKKIIEVSVKFMAAQSVVMNQPVNF